MRRQGQREKARRRRIEQLYEEMHARHRRGGLLCRRRGKETKGRRESKLHQEMRQGRHHFAVRLQKRPGIFRGVSFWTDDDRRYKTTASDCACALAKPEAHVRGFTRRRNLARN